MNINSQNSNNWKWQLSNRINTVEKLSKYLSLSDDEQERIKSAGNKFTWTLTPYYAELMDPKDENCPVRKQALADIEELNDPLGIPDPLDEGKHQPVELIIRVYPDRVAFCVGNRCAMYCRHCLRKETMVGKQDVNFSQDKIQNGIEYIKNTPEIRDVLLTGGDPLLMSDEKIEHILARLHDIPHVEVIRIGSRTPCTLPQRITDELCQMLKKYHPLYLNTQFNHPKEITPQAEKACAMLADAGIPLGNQSVLMKGINDSVEVMKKLCQELMRIRVRPYYLYQCQVLSGTRHLRTPIERGREIIESLQGHTSGLAVPKYVLDTPYGKIPISPNYVVGREGDDFVLRSWDGKIWREPNPIENNGNANSLNVEAKNQPADNRCNASCSSGL